MKPKKSKRKSERKLLIAAGAFLLIAVIVIIWVSGGAKPDKLPLLGDPVYKKVNTAKGVKTDTIYPVIPPFSFVDQSNRPVGNQTYKDHIYIADFFFTSCPTICPVMSRNLKKVYDQYANAPGLMFLSYSIDPKYDTPEVLSRYADKLGVNASRWHFVTGNKDAIYTLAEKGYYSPARKDDGANGGYVHSGGLFLVDRNGHMRGVYDGTSDEEVAQLLRDVKTLMTEK
ncbi:protein SCO1/2 [Mucilaginibacter gracilis]|uniref:Protein SCO1/2 n=1 Tax=Mucilaginibacter gracilis TaxID=423350 RepID=A0A495J5C9_9SPHI|nr:SCO family protein [Mucilaginibacter gracilis]RKR84157.1 protein SCO1/2 [Mucilaginibacter gracilis]